MHDGIVLNNGTTRTDAESMLINLQLVDTSSSLEVNIAQLMKTVSQPAVKATPVETLIRRPGFCFSLSKILCPHLGLIVREFGTLAYLFNDWLALSKS